MKTGILSKQGKFYVPLWLYDTGAAPIAIQARLLGQGRSAPLRKVIDFQSGE